MNQTTKQQIKQFMNQLEGIKSSVEKIQDEEMKYFHNIPENLQGGVLSKMSIESIDKLDGALTNLSDTIRFLDMAKTYDIL